MEQAGSQADGESYNSKQATLALAHRTEVLAMFRCFVAAVLALMFSLASPSAAHFGILVHPRPVAAYYYAVPAPTYFGPVVCVPITVPNVAVRPLAQPQAAPPSQSPEPPSAEPRLKPKEPPSSPPTPPPSKPGEPRVSNYFDTYSVSPKDSTRTPGDRCSVSFWNLSGKELTLKIGEQRIPLGSGRHATLDLDRQFTWQIEGRSSESGKVDSTNSALEIIIRR
jgi:hypothetical protein